MAVAYVRQSQCPLPGFCLRDVVFSVESVVELIFDVGVELEALSIKLEFSFDGK